MVTKVVVGRGRRDTTRRGVAGSMRMGGGTGVIVGEACRRARGVKVTPGDRKRAQVGLQHAQPRR